MANIAFRLFDLIQGPVVFQFVWHLLTGVSRLTEAEIQAASPVLGPDAIQFGRVRIAEGRVLKLIFKLNNSRAFTTFRTINLPLTGHHSRSQTDLIVHELVHVYQYERVGSIYIWEALRAQRTGGYQYGGPQQLVLDRSDGKRLKDFNREQQGQIAQDYYDDVVDKRLADDDPTRLAYEPFINDLRAGEL